MNPRLLGPRLGGKVQEVIRAVKAGAWTRSGERITAAGVELEPGEYDLKLVAADPGSTSALPGHTGLIALATKVTPELEAEGAARDVVRLVQQARRNAGLAVSDRVRLTIGADSRTADAIRAHAEFVAGETLAVSLEVRPADEVSTDPQPLGGTSVKVAISRETGSASLSWTVTPAILGVTVHDQRSPGRLGGGRPGSPVPPRSPRSLGRTSLRPSSWSSCTCTGITGLLRASRR